MKDRDQNKQTFKKELEENWDYADRRTLKNTINIIRELKEYITMMKQEQDTTKEHSQNFFKKHLQIKNTIVETENWIKCEEISQKGEHAEMEEMSEKKIRRLVQEGPITGNDWEKVVQSS